MTEPNTNKAALSLLIDDDGNDAIGKVTASPAANTLLGRLKAIADSVGGTGSSAITDLLGITTKGQKTKAESLPVVLASDQDTMTVSGPLTDTELRASSVPVSGPVTDTELRASPVEVSDTWEQAIISDVTDDDSDKTLTVPAATEWQPLALHITLATTADVGDRQLAVLFTDADDNVLAQVRPNVTQAASLTRYYSIALGQPDDLAFYDTDLVRVPMPVVALAAGHKIRVYDNNAVAAAADDMHLHLTVMAR